MIYAMSDLHGCDDLYFKMLEKINFSDNDTLYILGDVIDRGDGGIKILLDMMKRKNVIPILGNHDYTCAYLLKRLKCKATEELKEIFKDWLNDGGLVTYQEYKKLDEETKKEIVEYLNCFSIFEEIETQSGSFFLSHTVPSKEMMSDFDNIDWHELIVGHQEYDQVYFEDKYIVTGHTPTGLIDFTSKGKIFEMNNNIAIDCGAVFCGTLGCICLDTMEKFYVSIEK